MSNDLKVLSGQSYPLGATLYPEGVNFSIYSHNATAVELLLFDYPDHRRPTLVIQLDPKLNRTFDYWHIFIPGLKNGQLYGYRVHGPNKPEQGLRFDAEKVLVDPYTRAVVTDNYDRLAAKIPGDNYDKAIKSVVVDNSTYDWDGDKPLEQPFSHSIIYELHVGGFTRHPNSAVPKKWRGTYRGLVEKIPYLKELGITTVELMPVQQFDPFDVPNPELTNYWGYSPIALFAPHNGYSSDPHPLAVLDEFRDMVKALHKAGISVLLDVVFNHTAEGDHTGPTLSMKGLENEVYYLLEEDQRKYKNYTGTGNTLRANHAVVRHLIHDCLRYWVQEMHVDGFRFDLASILSRDENGEPMTRSPILWTIDSGPVLASAKIIAEAWDLNVYQLGNFAGDRWAEWNGQFRDDVRRFIKGDAGMVRIFANRLTASIDIFKEIIRDPNRSINFVTCHDGFTLNDLVSYNEKHNLANGEDNRDGTNHNLSWNCGVEGPTDDPEIEKIRLRQIKNFFTVLMISQGTPMMLMGDEVRRTQFGNNNAYCQDNEISWFDWDLVERNQELLAFVRKLIRFNMVAGFFQEENFWLAPEPISRTAIEFHGPELGKPDWSHDSHSLAFTLRNRENERILHCMINMWEEPILFEIPRKERMNWHKIIDTAAPATQDIYFLKDAPKVTSGKMEVAGRSIVLVLARYSF